MQVKRKSNWQGRTISKEFKINREIVRNRDEGCCIRCLTVEGRVVAGQEADHFIPVSRGGTDSLDNLWLLCVACHQEKTQRESNKLSGFNDTIGLDGFIIKDINWLAVIAKRNEDRIKSISI